MSTHVSGTPAAQSPAYTPALLSAILKATADNLDRTPVAIVVEEALRDAVLRGVEDGAPLLSAITRALRDTAAVVDTVGDFQAWKAEL